MTMEMLQDFMGYRVEWGENGSRSYVDGTVMHLARLDA